MKSVGTFFTIRLAGELICFPLLSLAFHDAKVMRVAQASSWPAVMSTALQGRGRGRDGHTHAAWLLDTAQSQKGRRQHVLAD